MDARDAALVGLGAVFSVLLLWRVARQFFITGVFVVAWLVLYEEVKGTYAGQMAMLGARKGVALLTAKISAWVGTF